MKIPIIIPCFNRPQSLSRLLNSISNANFDSFNVDLIFSIDGPPQPDIINIVERFEWKNGNKKIIKHSSNLGLKKHIISCGDILLTEEYDGAIILEDDLFVSPNFYTYSIQASQFYFNEKNIAGISLYAPIFNETSMLPFTTLQNGFDTYFMQLPSSWGQIWSKEHWNRFKFFLDKNPNTNWESLLPHNIYNWPNTSWKKEYVKHMIYNDLYFVYPYQSLTTNFADMGVHFKSKSKILQTPLSTFKRNWQFTSYDTKTIKYDAFGELTIDSFKIENLKINLHDIEVNLNFTKTLKNLSKKYVLTYLNDNNKSSSFLSFDDEILPIENNVILNNQGEKIGVISTEKINLISKEDTYSVRFNTLVYVFQLYYENGKKSILNRIPAFIVVTLRCLRKIYKKSPVL